MEFNVKNIEGIKKLILRHIYNKKVSRASVEKDLYHTESKLYKKYDWNNIKSIKQSEVWKILATDNFNKPKNMIESGTFRILSDNTVLKEDVEEELLRREIAMEADERFWQNAFTYWRRKKNPKKKKYRKRKKKVVYFNVNYILKMRKPLGTFQMTNSFKRRFKMAKELVRKHKELFNVRTPGFITQKEFREFLKKYLKMHSKIDLLEWYKNLRNK